MSSHEELQAKQVYLREHIPEDQYEDFCDYCENFAGNLEEEFETWSMEHLQAIVHKYFAHQHAKNMNTNKKEYTSFYAYQTGNEKQLKELRQQLKREEQMTLPQSNTIPHKQPATNKTSPQGQGKVPQQQTAIQFLDSIFDKDKPNSGPAKEEFQTKKYDKSFFESNKFWQVPSLGEPAGKKQSQANAYKTEVKFATNSAPINNQNFQVMFTSGLNIPTNTQSLSQSPKEQSKIFKKQPEQKARQWSMDSIVEDKPVKSEETKKARQWNMVEIEVEDDPIGNHKPISQSKMSESNVTQTKKSNITLKSIKNINTPTKKVPYQGETIIKQSLVTSVACFKSLQRVALSHKDLKVSIKNHEIIERSFFSSNYPMFHLKVLPANVTCKRNFEDFIKLKKNLQGAYPGLRLPYLDKQGIFESQTSVQYIERQKKYLQFFMEDLLTHPELRNSRILQYFLTLKDHKAMKRKFQEYDQKIKKVSALQQLCLLDGQVPIQLTEQNRQYCQLLPRLLDKINVFWDRQEKMLLQIDQLYSDLVQGYKGWNQAIQAIRKDVIEFNQRVGSSELLSLESTFDQLSKYAKECKSSNQNQKKIIENNVLPILRYEKQNMNQLNELINTQSQLTRAYINRKNQENSQDNLEYLSERLKDFKIGVLTESSNLTVLKYQCGYINYLLPKETQRYFDRLSNKTSTMLSDICYGKLQNLSKSTSVYTQLVMS